MILKRLMRRLRALVRRGRVEQELADELALHLDLEQQKNERLGMSPDAARRAALITFGGVERYKEEARDARGVRPLETFAQDLRHALRAMRLAPLFTFIVVLTLGLGVGATSAIYSIVNAVLLRPLPYVQGDQLVRVYSQDPSGRLERFSVSIPDFFDFKQRNRVFTDMAMWFNSTMTLNGSGGDPERLAAIVASDNLFSLLGVAPLHGRLFAPDEAVHGNGVVLSYGLWTRRFGSDSAIIGRRVTLDGTARTVIGVLPPQFRLYTIDADVWEPMIVDQVPKHDNRANHMLRVAARLRPGVSVAAAQLDMRRVARELAAEYPRADEGWKANVYSMRGIIVGDISRPLLILLAASGFLLLIACINVANLQLTRSAARARELAVRRALGASRGRLAAQLLIESSAYAAFGGLSGIILGVFGTRALVAIAPSGISRLDEVSLDTRVFAFAMVVALGTGLLVGLWPALRASNPRIGGALRDYERGSTGGLHAWRLRGALVVAELALTLMLLVGAGLVLQSFEKMLELDLGIRSDNVVVASLSLPDRYADSAQSPFYRELQARLLATPGITAASASDRAPVQGGGISTDIRLVERPEANVTGTLMSQVSAVVPGYFRTMGVPLIQGRDIRWNEGQMVALVNASAATRFWPGATAIGKHIGFGRRATDSGFTVIGVVADVRRGDITAREEPMIYIPLASAAGVVRSMAVVVRGTSGTTATVAAVKRAVHDIDPSLPLFDIRTIDTIVDEVVAQPRLDATLLASFAVLALVLAIVGIYGVVSHSVAQRRREIGVRVALGAQPRDVFSFVLRQGASLAVVGVTIGLVGSWMLTPVLRSWLYEIEPSDPLTYALLAVLLVAVALAGTAIPAHRATRVDPVLAMRADG